MKCRDCIHYGICEYSTFANKEIECKDFINKESCYNVLKNSTNFDRIKHNILKMDIEKFIDFCGGESCENVLCGQITADYAHCSNGKGLNCGECIREYLERKID